MVCLVVLQHFRGVSMIGRSISLVFLTMLYLLEQAIGLLVVLVIQVIGPATTICLLVAVAAAQYFGYIDLYSYWVSARTWVTSFF